MMYHHQWLWLIGANGYAFELFNGARTAAYLSSPPSEALGCTKIYNVLDWGGCEAYEWSPPCTPDDEEWAQQVYSTPALDDAPWYSATHPESAEALGFWIEEWTGLDSPHVRRSTLPLGRVPGGAMLGRTSAGPRVMKFNVLLFGMSELALEYLFRWLEATLIGVCSSCETDSILFRRVCPTVDFEAIPVSQAELWAGVGFARNVGLIEGLSWESEPVADEGCFLRRVSFTLAAGDPCLYGPDLPIASAQTLTPQACMAASEADFSPSWEDCRPACGSLAAACHAVVSFSPDVTGAATPVVEIINASATEPIPELIVRFYADPNSMGAALRCGLPLLGELRLHRLPPSTTFTYDVAARRVLFHDGTTALPVDGWAFVQNNDPGVPRFFAMPCVPIHAVVEVGSRCYEPTGTAGSSPWSDGEGTFNPPVVSFNVNMVERFGCP